MTRASTLIPASPRALSMSKPAKVIPIMSASAEGGTALSSSRCTRSSRRSTRGRSGGWFANWRWVFVWLTQLLFYGLPWLQWVAGKAVLFDLDAQRFYIFGLLLYPQDLIFLAALLVLSALALFSSPPWRAACGAATPVRRRSTPRSSCGPSGRSRATGLPACAWTSNRGGGTRSGAKGAKHSAWLSIALFTGFSFVGYFTPIRELAMDLASWNLSDGTRSGSCSTAPPRTATRASCASRCASTCALTRAFQSALIDKDSLIITYDAKRGRPARIALAQGGLGRSRLGDCIDCTLCVQVCPLASTSAMGCRTNASAARPASTSATT